MLSSFSFVKQNNQQFGYSLTQLKMPLCYNILMDIEPADKPDNLPAARQHEPIKLKYRRFADRYIINGMNATEAYQHIFKPKKPENAHNEAWKITAKPSVKAYIENRLIELNEINYAPEAIKSALSNKATSARRDSDALRALELMARITGLLTDGGNNTQVNIVTDDIMRLAKKRLSERKESDKRQDVTSPESSDIISFESVLPPNTSSQAGDAIDSSKAGNDGGEKDSPRGGGGIEPPPTP
jgi:hypothetical protein